VFAGTVDGLYRSDDKGGSWQRTGQGIPSTNVHSIQIDPVNPDIMAALTWGKGGLLRSVDGGEAWESLSFGLNRDIRDLRSYTSQFILVVIDEGEVFASFDRGDTWTRQAQEFESVYDLVIHSEQAQHHFALYGDRDQAALSRDGGLTWSPCELPSGHEPVGAYFDPEDPEAIYLPATGQLARTRDACATWTIYDHEWLERLRFFQTDPHRSGTIYASNRDEIRKSTDWGATWYKFGPRVSDPYSWAISLSATNPDIIYIAAEAEDERRGVFRSLSGGESWWIGTSGLNISEVRGLQVDPINPSTMYAGAGPTYHGEGLFKSMDSGQTWKLLEGTEDAGPLVAIDPLLPNVVYASNADSAILKSTDHGETWSEVWSGVGEDIEFLTIDPYRSGTLYAAIDPYGQLRRSDDGGVSWTYLGRVNSNATLTGLYPHPGKSGTLFATSNGGLVYVSNDRGDTWTTSTSGLETGVPCNPWYCQTYHYVTHLTFDPSNPDRIYASAEEGPFRSFDGGATWRPIWTGMLYCCAEPGTWDEICGSLKQTKTSGGDECGGGPRAMTVDPDHPEIVYATTRGGTYRSSNRGFTWERIESNPEHRRVLGITAIGDNVLLGWSGSAGVLRMELDEPQRRRLPRHRVIPSPSPAGEKLSLPD
jgi:photosystem II stability/assembly factor-like uncharacterized protein